MSPEHCETLIEAATAIRAGRISSVEMTEAALDRARVSQARLHAFIEIEEGSALAAARAADAELAAGRTCGPLHGVPLAHKDMYDRAGKITGCGSTIRGASVAAETSTVMARLEAAGALSIGRLAMSEFAMGPTGHNVHHGRAMNPIQPSRITAGSSSGSGAAVGGGVVLAALGSDTGGSIRLPAACCGIVGIKPTQGRVSRHGVMPLSFSQDCVGPLARNVADAYLMLRLIAGADPRDATCAAIEPPPARLPECASLRIGLDETFFADGLDPEVTAGMADIGGALTGQIGSMSTVPLPDLSAVAELANVVAMSEAAAVHFDALRERPEDFGPQVRMRLSQGLAVPAPVYLRALQIRALMLREFVERVFSRCDALIVPVMPFLPPLSADVDVGSGPAMHRIVSDMTKFTRPFSYLGLPVVTMPVARSRGGLPVSIQIVTAPWREDVGAAVAALLETTLALPAFDAQP